MVTKIAIAAVAAAMVGCLPAYGQQEGEELEGAPGWQKAVKPAPVQKKPAAPVQKKPAAPVAPARTQAQPPQQQKTQAQAATDKAKADQAKLAQQAEAQKAERASLARQTAELKALQARIDARVAELAAEEKRLERLRIDQETIQAAKLAELERQRDATVQEEAQRSERQRQTADLSVEANGAVRPGRDTGADDAEDNADINLRDGLPDARPETRRPLYARLDFENAERSCARAGEDAALARNFYSARYDSMPNIFQDGGWELRGRMRLQDRRGFLIVDTVCEVDADGEARRFAFLR